MMRLIKQNILGFILGGIVFSSVIVLAYSFAAGDVSFNPDKTTFNVHDVASALNILYDRSGNILERIDGEISKNVYFGDILESASTTLNLTEGDYYIFTIYSNSRLATGSSIKEYNTDLNENYNISNMTCEIVDTQGKIYPSSQKASSNDYLRTAIIGSILKCHVEESGIISVIHPSGWSEEHKATQYMSLQSIKID